MDDLLSGIGYSLDAILRSNAEDGMLFYAVSQCKDLLEISECQVRYAIETYRLDALFLAGEYRIPYTAILRFADSDWLEDSIEYLNAHKRVDLEGVYALNFEGKVGPIVRYLTEMDLPLDMIPQLLGKDTRREYDELPGEEKELEDWYDLDELRMPLKATIAEYSRLLRTKCDWLCQKMSEGRRKAMRGLDMVDYPEVLDILIVHEMVNYPIPIVLEPYVASKRKADGGRQLTLDI